MGYTVPVLIAVASAIRRPYQPSPSSSAASTASIGMVIRVMGWMLASDTLVADLRSDMIQITPHA